MTGRQRRSILAPLTAISSAAAEQEPYDDKMSSTPPEKNPEVQNAHSLAERGDVSTDEIGTPQFDKEAERKLRTKIDWATVPIVALLYLFCFIDRTNIGNARLAGLERDLALKNYDYNTVLSIFYISYIIFEIPSGIVCKWMGPAKFIPLITLLFGIVSIGTAFVNSIGQACAVRFLLGIFEAGMMPCISFYLSRWYRRAELTFRLSLFLVMAPMAGAFGGLLASGILSLPNFGSLHEWRMIFAIEGIITIGLALIAFFTLTESPETAKWLTAEEKEMAIARIKSERMAQSEVVDAMGKQKLWLGFWNPVVLATGAIFLLNNITVQGLAFFTPTIVASIYPTFTTVQKQLYTVPPYVVGAFFELLLPLLSWRFDKRMIFIVASAPMVMVGYIMFLAATNATTRYAASFLTASSCFALGALCNAIASAVTSSDSARSISLTTNMMFGNIGGLIATWTYLPWDAPTNYKIGNGINLAASSLILILSTLTLLWMLRDNKTRAKRNVEEELRGLSQAEIESLEWKHPGWRWHP